MNTTILARGLKTDATRGDLRPSKRPPRPIPCPKSRPNSRFGGGQ
jgi:hypothetical protein